jgi:hypothetical protein
VPSTLDPASAVPPRTACTTSPLDNPCSAKSGGQRKDETSRNIGSLAFPCKRADHPEVRARKLPAARAAVKRFKKSAFHRMWTTVWKRCALFAPAVARLWTRIHEKSDSVLMHFDAAPGEL